MPLYIIRNDLTRMNVDAIVNATDPFYSGASGTDRAIHTAAGPELRRTCDALGRCGEGEAKLTRAFELPCRYVIHTVGSHWDGGSFSAREKLSDCYSNSLRLAALFGCESIAFPLISAGNFGWPAAEAMLTAKDAIGKFLENSDMTVYIVLFNRDAFRVGNELFGSITAYIDDNYAAEKHAAYPRISNRWEASLPSPAQIPCPFPMTSGARREDAASAPAPKAGKKSKSFPKPTEAIPEKRVDAPAQQTDAADSELARYIASMRDEGFAQMLFRCIDERGMTDTECYKRANIDRKLFSKIRSDINYRPSKTTVLAFAVSLRLTVEETHELLRKAGYALSPASKGDIIVRYFLERGCYNIYSINEALFSFDQKLLGS